MATATSYLTDWLGSISESTNWHGPKQSGSVLVFKQHGQSESQCSRTLCVTAQHIFSQVCTIPWLRDHISPLKHSLPRGEKRSQLPSSPNSSYLGCTCHQRNLPLLIRLFPLLQVCYALSKLTCRDQECYTKSEQMLQSYQTAVVPGWLQYSPFSSFSHFCRHLGGREFPEA